MDGFLTGINISLLAIFKTEYQIFFKYIITVNKLEYFLIAIHSKSFEKYEDGYKFSKTAGEDIHFTIFDQHLAHCLSIDRVRNDSSYYTV